MRTLAFVALASVFALAGCTKTPAGENVTPADVTPTRYDPPPGYEPTPTTTTPSPTPSTPPTRPTSPPTQPTQPPAPNATAAPPASTPSDYARAQTGWVAPNSQTDPNATIRLNFPVELGARNVTIHASDALVLPTGWLHGSPFALRVIDPHGKTIASAGTSLDPTSFQAPPAPTSASPENATYELNTSAWKAGEYSLVLTITPAVTGDSATVGERYALSVYVHY